MTVEQDDLKLFRQARFDVKKLAGKHLRVRVGIEQHNGPEMVVSTPAAIQILDEAAPAAADSIKPPTQKSRRKNSLKLRRRSGRGKRKPD